MKNIKLVKRILSSFTAIVIAVTFALPLMPMHASADVSNNLRSQNIMLYPDSSDNITYTANRISVSDGENASNGKQLIVYAKLEVRNTLNSAIPTGVKLSAQMVFTALICIIAGWALYYKKGRKERED